VVCYKRNFGAGAGSEKTAAATLTDGGVGGGGVTLGAPLGVKEGEWIALTGTGVCRWYRVVAVDDSGTNLTLNGPDWPGGAATAVAIDKSVLGVYTTSVELDSDPLWLKK
jgi:hypothetical protein